jgi:predicted Zn-dependent protease
MFNKLETRLMLFLMFVFLFINCAQAKSQITIIRDTEIEDFLYEISRPIFITAGLNPNQVKFYIVQNNSINAFVSGGQNIFINTGTLTHFDEPDAVLGIIAHETGHIAGGHLARFSEEMKKQQKFAAGTIAISLLAGLAGGMDVMQASLFGGMHIERQNLLHYTRAQEEAADQSAINYLLQNNLSPEALLKSMKEFRRDEAGIDSVMEYYVTHPLSKNRAQHIKANLNPKINNNDFNAKYEKKFNFIKAKIVGYTESQNMVLQKYPKTDNSDYALYARAISYSLSGDQASFDEITLLLKRDDKNPYILETCGNIMFNFKKADDAIKYYQKANKLLPNKPLIKTPLALLIIKSERTDLYPEAILNLKKALKIDGNNLQAWRLLAEVYHKIDRKDLSYLNLAEYYMRIGDKQRTLRNLELARQNTKDKQVLLRIEDARKGI